MLLGCTTRIAAPAGTVFACVDDPRHIVGWVQGAVEHVYLTERPPLTAVGQRFRQRLRQGKAIRSFDGEIIAWTPATHFGLRIPTPAYTSEAHFRIAPVGTDASRLDYSIDIALHSPLAKLLGPLLRLPLRLFVRRQVASLKAYAERAPASRLRRLRVGDTWHYQVSGRIVPATGTQRLLTGEITVSVTPDRLPERPDALLLTFAQTLHDVHPDGPRALPAPAWRFAFLQDEATGDVAIVADTMGPGGTWRIAETPQVFYPGTWSVDTAYANRLVFPGGDVVANTLAVTGHAALTTPAGVFLSWVAGITSDSPALGAISGTDWWVPELGAPARFETASRMPDGARMLLTARLDGTNVAPDACCR